MDPRLRDWNISLFHDRNQVADHGRILVGIQVPDAAEFRVFADALGYPWVDETGNPIYRLFLQMPP